MSSKKKNEERPLQMPLVDASRLPPLWPTHLHPPAFWEHLGRLVGSYGMLEEVLLRAIFQLTGSVPAAEDETKRKAQIEAWIAELEAAMEDQLYVLTNRFSEGLKLHRCTRGLQKRRAKLLDELHAARKIRNLLCHASWEVPDKKSGKCRPGLRRKAKGVPDAIDSEWLAQQTRKVGLVVGAVMNSVIELGLPFPGVPRRARA